MTDSESAEQEARRTVLVVVDMQNDFVDGPLGTPEAQAIVAGVERRIREHRGPVLYTRDTHRENYLQTQEGKNLPVVHCIRGTWGWQLVPAIRALAIEEDIFDKPAFGSVELARYVASLRNAGEIDRVDLVGVCTDICVISNAILLKAAAPELEVSVDASCCAGVTPQSHANALEAMKMCQIRVY